MYDTTKQWHGPKRKVPTVFPCTIFSWSISSHLPNSHQITWQFRFSRQWSLGIITNACIHANINSKLLTSTSARRHATQSSISITPASASQPVQVQPSGSCGSRVSQPLYTEPMGFWGGRQRTLNQKMKIIFSCKLHNNYEDISVAQCHNMSKVLYSSLQFIVKRRLSFAMHQVYTQWTIKKRDILFLTITLANLNRFL